MIQIRNVPDDLHRTLKARAAEAGMSLSDYLLREIDQVGKIPTLAEMKARLDALPAPESSISATDMIRELRGPL